MARASTPASPDLAAWNASTAAGKYSRTIDELGGDLLALPCGVLAGAGKHGDGLREFGARCRSPGGSLLTLDGAAGRAAFWAPLPAQLSCRMTPRMIVPAAGPRSPG